MIRFAEGSPWTRAMMDSEKAGDEEEAETIMPTDAEDSVADLPFQSSIDQSICSEVAPLPAEEPREMRYAFVHSCISCSPGRTPCGSRSPSQSRDASPAPAALEAQRPQSKAGRSRSPSPPQTAIATVVVGTLGPRQNQTLAKDEDLSSGSRFPTGQVLSASNPRPATSPSP